jgi:hypothetical protein
MEDKVKFSFHQDVAGRYLVTVVQNKMGKKTGTGIWFAGRNSMTLKADYAPGRIGPRWINSILKEMPR